MYKNSVALKILLLATVWALLLNITTAEARQGCCSHHGGVCGCGCCDGSPLSATCAPYYPNCNGGGSANITSITSPPPPRPKTAAPVTPVPVIEPLNTFKNTPVDVTGFDNVPAAVQPAEEESGWDWIVGGGLVAGVAYWIGRIKKEK
jgi:hypothetical protein